MKTIKKQNEASVKTVVEQPKSAEGGALTVASLLLNRRAFVAQRLASMRDDISTRREELRTAAVDESPHFIAQLSAMLECDAMKLSGYEAAIRDILEPLESSLSFIDKVK